MVAFSTKYMLRSILAAFKRRRKKTLARETKTFWRKKGFPGRKTPFAKPFSAFQKLRAAPEIATIYLEQVIKQNDWTLLPIGRHFCLWFYGRARAKEIWALDNRLTNQTKVPFVSSTTSWILCDAVIGSNLVARNSRSEYLSFWLAHFDSELFHWSLRTRVNLLKWSRFWAQIYIAIWRIIPVVVSRPITME